MFPKLKFRQRQVMLGVVVVCFLTFTIINHQQSAETDNPIRKSAAEIQGDDFRLLFQTGRNLDAKLRGKLPFSVNLTSDSLSKDNHAENYNKNDQRSGGKNGESLKEIFPNAQDIPENTHNNYDEDNHIHFISRLNKSGVGECPSLLGPVNVFETYTFQEVDGKNSFYVFSAHLDSAENLVRVIALTRFKTNPGIACLLWYDNEEDAERGAPKMHRVTTAGFMAIPERHKRL